MDDSSTIQHDSNDHPLFNMDITFPITLPPAGIREHNNEPHIPAISHINHVSTNVLDLKNSMGGKITASKVRTKPYPQNMLAMISWVLR